MYRRPVILLGDITDHGGNVLNGGSARYGGRPIARVGDMVSCPMHGDNSIMGGKSTVLLDGRLIAVEGMSTECGSHLIASQIMFNIFESKKDRYGYYYLRLWNKTTPVQPLYNPYGASPFPGPDGNPEEYSLYPPDSIRVVPPITGD